MRGIEPVRACVVIVVSNPINRRLIEAASAHLELTPEVMDAGVLEGADAAQHLLQCELVVADEAEAKKVQQILAPMFQNPDNVTPAVIAVRERDAPAPAGSESAKPQFDGVLTLPQEPAPILTQLGLILYAHRAYAQKYQ